MNGLYKVDKLFLLNLDGAPELYAKLSDDTEEDEALPDEAAEQQEEEIVEEVVHPEEDPYVMFEEAADDEELIVTDEPEIFEVELPGEELDEEPQTEVSIEMLLHIYVILNEYH